MRYDTVSGWSCGLMDDVCKSTRYADVLTASALLERSAGVVRRVSIDGQ